MHRKGCSIGDAIAGYMTLSSINQKDKQQIAVLTTFVYASDDRDRL